MSRIKQNLNLDWKFKRHNQPFSGYKGLDDSEWKTVTLPHDWSVEEEFSKNYSSGTGYLANGVGWYRKRFTLPETLRGKRVFITFEGVYNNSQVWCNTYYIDKRPYGYSTFSYDITDFIQFGDVDNVIAVKVNHKDSADSRWFTGSGIYRNVYLTITDNTHFDEYGVFVTTPQVSQESATINIDMDIILGNNKAENLTLFCTMLDAKGQVVANAEKSIATQDNALKTHQQQRLTVNNPTLWSPNQPYLYNLRTRICKENIMIDEIETSVGLRWFKFDSKQGFFLNGQNTKIKGVCLHHDAGCLGAAVPQKVWKKRLLDLKEMGCNAIRCSHNPPAPDFLDVCDQLGFLVQDEAFDEWEGVKNKWWQGHNVYPPKHDGYYEDFPQWHKRDLQGMVKRDRNHPSIIFWSIGNEIDYPNDPYCHPYFKEMRGNNDKNKPLAERMYDPNKPNAERLVTIANRLVNLVKECDITRPVTAALAFPELSNLTGLADTLDVVGYNYKEHRYEEDCNKWPNRVIYGSENGKGLEQWLKVRDHDNICAQFIWTGIDYLGEAEGWPVRMAQPGFMDVGGFKKPCYYYRQSLWSEKPMVQLTTQVDNTEAFHWNYKQSELVEVNCYSNCTEVELFLNNDSLGRKKITELPELFAKWEVSFEYGELKAVAYDTEGNEHISTLKSVKESKQIVVIPREREMIANGQDVCEVELYIMDIDDAYVRHIQSLITLSIDGPGEILGIENGDAADLEPYYSKKRRTYNGHLKAYIRSKRESGTITLSASGENVIEGKATILVVDPIADSIV